MEEMTLHTLGGEENWAAPGKEDAGEEPTSKGAGRGTSSTCMGMGEKEELLCEDADWGQSFGLIYWKGREEGGLP